MEGVEWHVGETKRLEETGWSSSNILSWSSPGSVRKVGGDLSIVRFPGSFERQILGLVHRGQDIRESQGVRLEDRGVLGKLNLIRLAFKERNENLQAIGVIFDLDK